MSELKIGFDAKRYFLNKTGLGNYARTLINGLSEHTQLSLHLYSPQIDESIDVPSGVSIHQPNRIFSKLFKKHWRNQGIVSDLEKDGIAIYHGLSNEIPIGIEKTSIKSIVTIHDLIFLKYPELYPSIDRKIYHKKVQSAVQRANHVVACSKQTAKDLKHFYEVPDQKISVIYQDCNPHFKYVADQSLPAILSSKYGLFDHFILSVGTLEKRKNQLNILRAFATANFKNTQLVFVGKKADLYPSMKTFVEENKLQDRVLFLDNIPQEELPALYQMASIFAYISYEEGFGIPLLEAMWSGVPIVAGKLSCLPEIVSDAAICVDPFNISNIAEAFTLLTEDLKLRKILIELGFERAQQFDNKKIALEWQQLYTALQ